MLKITLSPEAADTFCIVAHMVLGSSTCLGFDMILIRFWYGSIELAAKKNRNNPATGFWSIFRAFLWLWYDFDIIVIRFWYDFDTVLIRFRYAVDMILIRFRSGFDRILDMVPLGWFQSTIWTHIKNHNWHHIKIISKTVSPYQHHNCKTTPEKITTTNHIWNVSKKRIFWKTFILETLVIIMLACGCAGVEKGGERKGGKKKGRRRDERERGRGKKKEWNGGKEREGEEEGMEGRLRGEGKGAVPTKPPPSSGPSWGEGEGEGDGEGMKRGTSV